jgi:hypothetical protein
MGQSSNDFPLQEERPDLPVTGSRNKDYITPTADRIQRHFAASFVHKTVTNWVFKAMDQARPSFRHLADQCKGISAEIKRRVFSGVRRTAYLLETSISTVFYAVT